MTRLPVVPYSVLQRVVAAAGFIWVRRKGSHNTFRNERGITIVIPDHGSQVIARPLLRRILREKNVSDDEYLRLLDEV